MGPDALEEMFARAATEAASRFSADVGVLLVGRDELRLEAQWGLDPHHLPDAPVPIPENVAELTASDPVRVGPLVELGVPEWLAGYGLEHVAWVRLVVGVEPLGVMMLGRRAAEAFERAAAEELRAVGYRVALAVQNRHLESGLTRQLARVRRLHEITTDLAAKLGLDELGASVAEAIAREVPGTGVAVYAGDYPAGVTLLAQAGESATQPAWRADASAPPAGGWLSLESAGERVGAVVLSDPPRPGSDEHEMLRHVIDLAGLAIHKAVLYERTRERAGRDSLTGLLGHGAFHEALERGLRDGLHEQGFSLALIDIDDFKQINDLHGHPAGDDALRRVADALCRHVRSVDSVFRIGGEEFCVLMPRLTAADSRMVAERLRKAVAALRGGLPLTVSVGIASYPEDATERDALIAGADAALYAAKRSGKNRTALAAETRLLEDDQRLSSDGGALAALLKLLQRKDGETAVHSAHVMALAVEVGRLLGVEGAELQNLRLAAQLHDLGKVGVPDEILSKPAKLSGAEFDVIKTHPEVGASLLRLWGLGDSARFVLEHHERPDGRGYPAGLRGGDITLEARILHAADAFVAMTLDRPYRAAMTLERALKELRRHSGSQFDPEVVGALISVLERQQLDAAADGDPAVA